MQEPSHQTHEPVHVACCFDEGMAASACVLAASMSKFSMDRRQTILHAFYVEEMQIDFESIRLQLRTEFFEVIFELVSNRVINKLPTEYSPHISRAAFARFMIGDLLPNCARVIYLDADTMILRPLAPLFDLDLKNNCLAAMVDPIQHVGRLHNDLPGTTKSYLQKHADKSVVDLSYFNIGVMLIDLCLWRSKGVRERLHFPNSLLSDQDALNELIGNNFTRMDACWNAFALYATKETTIREATFFGVPESVETLIKWWGDPCIVHFAGRCKPWRDEDGRTSFDALFWTLLGGVAHGHAVLERILANRRKSIKSTITDMARSGSRLPLVSVIIVNHNYGRFLSECVQSVFDQSYPQIECIIVDNRSTDESASRINELIDRYPSIRVVWLPTNEGQCSAMQRGFALATGSYTVFLDADDFLLDDFVGTHIEAHLSLSVAVGFTSSDMLQMHGQKIMGNIGLAHPSQSKLITAEQRTDQKAADKLSYDFFWRYRGDKLPMRLASKSSVEWIWAPTSGSVYRSDAVRLFIDNPELKNLKLAGDAYLNYGINSLVGSVLLDRALSVYRVHDKNNFTRSVRLSEFKSFESGEEKSPQAAYLALKHIVKNYDAFAARSYNVLDLSKGLATLYRKANGNRLLIIIDGLHARWTKIIWEMRLQGMMKKRESRPAPESARDPATDQLVS